MPRPAAPQIYRDQLAAGSSPDAADVLRRHAVFDNSLRKYLMLDPMDVVNKT
jgi:hypothetical protein